MAEAEEQSEGKEKREKGRERERGLTKIFSKFSMETRKKFEHESRSKFKFLQLSFQAKIHLSNDLKVKNLTSNLNENPLNPLFSGFAPNFML